MVTGISAGKLLVRTLLIAPLFLSRDAGHQGLPGKLPDLMGNMAPSESFLARLSRKHNEQWESRRKTFESMKKP